MVESLAVRRVALIVKTHVPFADVVADELSSAFEERWQKLVLARDGVEALRQALRDVERVAPRDQGGSGGAADLKDVE